MHSNGAFELANYGNDIDKKFREIVWEKQWGYLCCFLAVKRLLAQWLD